MSTLIQGEDKDKDKDKEDKEESGLFAGHAGTRPRAMQSEESWAHQQGACKPTTTIASNSSSSGHGMTRDEWISGLNQLCSAGTC